MTEKTLEKRRKVEARLKKSLSTIYDKHHPKKGSAPEEKKRRNGIRNSRK